MIGIKDPWYNNFWFYVGMGWSLLGLFALYLYLTMAVPRAHADTCRFNTEGHYRVCGTDYPRQYPPYVRVLGH